MSESERRWKECEKAVSDVGKSWHGGRLGVRAKRQVQRREESVRRGGERVRKR